MEFKRGDNICCVRCGGSFILGDDTFYLTSTDEIIKCPHCQFETSVDTYHFKYGNKDDINNDNFNRLEQSEFDEEIIAADIAYFEKEVYQSWINYILLGKTLDTHDRKCIIGFRKKATFEKMLPILKRDFDEKVAFHATFSDDKLNAAEYGMITIEW